MISQDLAGAINEQVGHEFGASMQYLEIASYFDDQNLRLLAKIFFEQAEEEREHAMKFIRYLLDTNGGVRIPAIPAPKADFSSAEEAVEAALNWEIEVTGQINRLYSMAVQENDYLAQSFLQWYVDEQLEEVSKMDALLSVVRRAGERNLLMVEAYLAHLDEGS
jgi:ferritin